MALFCPHLPRAQPVKWHSSQCEQEGSKKERLGCGGAKRDPVSPAALHQNRAHPTPQQRRSHGRGMYKHASFFFFPSLRKH